MSEKTKLSITNAVEIEGNDKIFGEATVSPTGGLRYDSGKVDMSQIPTSTMYAIARVFQYGAQKYSNHNWRKGMEWSKPYSCAMRHMAKWYEGEENDDESGLPHLYHVLTNIAMLVEYSKTCPELDNRYKGPSRTYKDVEDFNKIK